MIEKATIETMTAEVRVLMVGRRQVTLSVARQLDTVELEDLDIMGRVKIDSSNLHVIGTAPDGTLAIAKYSRPRMHPPEIIPGDLDQPIRCCWHGFDPRSSVRMAMDGREFVAHPLTTEECADHRADPEGGWHRNPELEAQLTQVMDEWDADSQHYFTQCTRAVGAPLIVLAGLK